MNETSEAVDNNTLNDMEINDLNTSTIPITELHDLHKLEADYKDHYYHVRIKNKKYVINCNIIKNYHIISYSIKFLIYLEISNSSIKIQEKYIEESAGFGTVINGEARKEKNPYKDSDIVAETLTQGPNLSQG